MDTEICITSRSHDKFGAAPQNGSIGGESRLCKKNEGIKYITKWLYIYIYYHFKMVITCYYHIL